MRKPAKYVKKNCTHKRLSQRLSIALLPLFFAASAWGQSTPIGYWKTFDDATGDPKSIISIYTKNGQQAGDVVRIIKASDAAVRNNAGQVICDKCDGERKDQPIDGMNIMWGFSQEGDQWDGGRILDPQNGKIYKAKMWLEDGALMVRGFIGFSLIGRSQQWQWIGTTLQ